MMFVERFDDGPNGHGWIIAMQQVDIDVIAAQANQRVGHVGRNIVRRDAIAVCVEVSALADENDFLAVAALFHPQAEHAIDFAACVKMGRIVGGNACRVGGIE